MKKIILIVLTLVLIIFMDSCGNMATAGKKQKVIHKYEVLLSTKDTMYVDAWFYDSSYATFTSDMTVKFYDTNWNDFLTIENPIYIKEIK